MEKSEIECCGTTHLHDSLVHQIEDGMPKEETIRELSDFFKVFGDMTRIKILCVLFQAELCVCDLAEVVDGYIVAHYKQGTHKIRVKVTATLNGYIFNNSKDIYIWK